ncbi:MAG: serine/threonine protein kinase [Phycisphaerales bacterium]|nr:serine/threonine protein kinase [Phycisphaerales bacterium]
MKQAEAAKPGTKLAGYSVLAEIGRGAASVIYLVQDPKTKQIWALKHVVRETPKDQRFIDQAEQEAMIGAKIGHPALRHIEKCIKTRSLMTVKELFLVMEYVDGVSLESHRPKTLVQAVDVFRQVARGLAHMHGRGFVHADMKPHNIVLRDDGSVKIIDLGQSCAVGTVKPRIQGTPDYIAPEQVHLRPITPKTDIYNLGATMYWTLTGAHIPTALPKHDSLVGSLDDHLIEKPKPVRDLRPDLPEMLAEVIMHSVEVDSERRPASMDLIADRLDLVFAKLRSAGSRRGPDDDGDPRSGNGK